MISCPSTFFITQSVLLSDDQKTHWHRHRLCELFPCDVRKILAFEWVLTFDAFRLNNRDNLRLRPSGDNSSNGFQIESIRQNKRSYNPKVAPTAVAVTVNSTTTADFATNVHGYDNKHGSDKSESAVWIQLKIGLIRKLQHHMTCDMLWPHDFFSLHGLPSTSTIRYYWAVKSYILGNICLRKFSKDCLWNYSMATVFFGSPSSLPAI